MTDFRLADAMNSSEPLFDAIRIPGEVVVHHKVRPLKVDPFASSVGCKEDLDRRIVFERFLRLCTLFTPHSTVNNDNRI